MLQQQVGRGVLMLPEQEQQLRCPRCDSTDTKFCYYNNYNLSQPRHFCRSCRRYWTKGGALRNVPVGGGTRKGSKRSGDADAAASCASKRPNVETGRETVVVGEEGGAAVGKGGVEGVNTSAKASEMAEGGGEGGGWSMSMGLSSMYPPRTTGTSFE